LCLLSSKANYKVNMNRQTKETNKNEIILLLIITLQLLAQFVVNNNHGIAATIVITVTIATE
jgi:Tfp pilus assembly protein PilW